MPDGFDATALATANEVLEGLSQPQKTLPAKFFYDAEGCRLFGEITRLPEYYVTRAERALLAAVAPLLPALPGSALVEYGASDEAKAVVVIDAIGSTAYVPIDIAAGALTALADRMALSHPNVSVHPLAADFLRPLTLPDAVADRARFGFFPGSTIGNLDPATACTFLDQVRAALGPRASFLIGVDLRKDPAILIPAYDDAQGVTAAFNINMLHHLNRRIAAGFDPSGFDHRAVWNDRESRIEMHLVSNRDQSIEIAGQPVSFRHGETIHTENSYKHTVEGFQALARSAGWTPADVWSDGLFSLHLLTSGAQA